MSAETVMALRSVVDVVCSHAPTLKPALVLVMLKLIEDKFDKIDQLFATGTLVDELIAIVKEQYKYLFDLKDNSDLLNIGMQILRCQTENEFFAKYREPIGVILLLQEYKATEAVK